VSLTSEQQQALFALLQALAAGVIAAIQVSQVVNKDELIINIKRAQLMWPEFEV